MEGDLIIIILLSCCFLAGLSQAKQENDTKSEGVKNLGSKSGNFLFPDEDSDLDDSERTEILTVLAVMAFVVVILVALVLLTCRKQILARSKTFDDESLSSLSEDNFSWKKSKINPLRLSGSKMNSRYRNDPDEVHQSTRTSLNPGSTLSGNQTFVNDLYNFERSTSRLPPVDYLDADTSRDHVDPRLQYSNSVNTFMPLQRQTSQDRLRGLPRTPFESCDGIRRENSHLENCEGNTRGNSRKAITRNTSHVSFSGDNNFVVYNKVFEYD